MTEPPKTIWVYRIVHIENLPLLLQQQGIWCGSEMAARALPYKTIGNADLTISRTQTPVTCGPGGKLCDYVPFYFGPRSVMLYSISKQNTTTYSGGQEPILHLGTTLDAVEQAGCRYVYTDRHASVKIRNYYESRADLWQLDWATIGSREWKNTPSDPDRRERKMAEFLVHRFVPWNCIRGIGVFSQSYRQDVEAVLAQYDSSTRVAVKQEWYY